MCGLAINIASFVHLLKRVDFDAIVDHLALTHLIKSKAEPTTIRIKRLLEVLSSYSFNLYHIKGRNMILNDFLSRQKHDNINPHEIIPISFIMQNLLQTRYYNIGEKKQGKYLDLTRSQAKSSGIILPKLCGIDKGIDPIIRLEKQVLKPIILPEPKGISQVKPRLGQGRAGIKQKTFRFPMSQLLDTLEPKLLPGRRSIMQIAESLPLQQSQNINESKTRSKV